MNGLSEKIEKNMYGSQIISVNFFVFTVLQENGIFAVKSSCF